MALLTVADNPRGAGTARRRRGRSWWALIAGGCLAALAPQISAQSKSGFSEYQVKAVFLFNFVQFVDWPADALPTAESPLVIGVLGDDPFGAFLDEAVVGEKINQHPLIVRRFQRVDEIDAVHVLFVSRSEQSHLKQIFSALKGRSILLVGEPEGFAVQGGTIRFVTENNKVRMRINLNAAKNSRLVISSKLLRAAEIVTTKD
jgi:hypothetical protein